MHRVLQINIYVLSFILTQRKCVKYTGGVINKYVLEETSQERDLFFLQRAQAVSGGPPSLLFPRDGKFSPPPEIKEAGVVISSLLSI
jgi:hypothetical protein